MPDERFIHPCLGQSAKVNLLTELEFRVWIHYLLAADDFGVMRFSAITVQHGSDALQAKPAKAIDRCLARLVDVGLCADFEHQQRKYLCQRDWVKYQRIRFPRTTHNPAPPRAMLETFDATTAGLFYDHHPACDEATLEGPQVGGDEGPLRSLMSEGLNNLSRPSGHANANANASCSSLRERFAEFWRHYPRRVGKDAAWKAWQKIKPGTVLLGQMLAVLAWQKQQDDWLKDRGQFIPYPSTWLNQGRWDDEPSDAVGVSPATLNAGRAMQEFLK